MDPYLEQAGLWREVHTRLIVAIADELGPLVQPTYRVAVEQRTYLAMVACDEAVIIPDIAVAKGDDERPLHPAQASQAQAGAEPGVFIAKLPMPEEMTERYLEIRHVATNEVVTSLEVLSPTNKHSGEGRRLYEEKRLRVLGSMTHLIEIDLLRTGSPMPMQTPEGFPFDYSIIVSRAYQRPKAEVRLFRVRQPIPAFPVPLRREEPEPTLELNRVLHELYDRAGYGLVIDYNPPPNPPLSRDDDAWMDALLREKHVRA
jgi:hypothetical protein